jgi:GrpB protein
MCLYIVGESSCPQVQVGVEPTRHTSASLASNNLIRASGSSPPDRVMSIVQLLGMASESKLYTAILDGSELSSALQTVLCDGEPSNTKLGHKTMIGLNRHIVQVVEHHPSWAALAADACQDVWRACGNLLTDLQHVGSTSVPDLPAKPILDIAAAVVTLDAIPALVQRLTSIGYIYRGDGGEEGSPLCQGIFARCPDTPFACC